MARILIMEDDAEFAFQVSDLLTVYDHDVHWHRTGSEAITALKKTTFDLVISDIYIYQDGRITTDGGIGLIGTMRSMAPPAGFEHWKTIPIIAISGAVNYPGNEYILNAAKSIGASRVLAKPFEDSDLMGLVNEVLGKQHQEL